MTRGGSNTSGPIWPPWRRQSTKEFPVDGYFHWSLLDNIEWLAGFSQRFGLIHVDQETLVRTPKASFDWYRDVIARNGLE